MKRLALGLALVLGACPEPPAAPRAEAPFVYAPDLAPWPPAPVVGEIGRGPRTGAPAPTGLRAGAGVWAIQPLDVEAIWTVPGDGPARAIASGLDGDAWAAEMIDVDAGVVRWRDLARCAAPVEHVSASAVVCSDAVHAVALAVDDGRELWRRDLRVTGGTGALAVASDAGAVVVIDASDGRELARSLVDLGNDEPRAACRDGDGFDVYTAGSSGAVRRIAIAPGAAGGRIAWTAMVGPVIELDPVGARSGETCDDVVTIAAAAGGDGETLAAIARGAGTLAGGPVAARGHWRARDSGDAIEIATDRGIERRSRALASPVALDAVQLAGLVASRGDRRLVRTRTGALVLLDKGDARTTLPAPVGVGRAVLGDRFVVSGPWHGVRTDRDTLRRYPLPAVARSQDPALDPILVDDPTRYDHPDLPAPAAVDPSNAIARAGAGTYHVAAALLDPAAPNILYAIPMEQRPSDKLGAGLAAFDLRARAWTWHRADACPPGTPSSIAIAPDADAIACAARVAARVSGVRATSRKDGHALWSWSGPVDELVGGAGAIAVISASRVTLVDGATGAELDRFGADDGWKPRVAITPGGLVVSAERGAIVARAIRAGLLPVWAVRVRGVVASIALAGDRLAVSLGDGELYFLDPATGAARPAGAWSAEWRVPGGADLALVPARDPSLREWRVAGYSTDGALRFRIALAPESDAHIGERGRAAGAPIAVAYGPGAREAAVLEPAHGGLRGLFTLPDRAVPGLVFSTVVDGKPVAGAVLSQPLAVVTFSLGPLL